MKLSVSLPNEDVEFLDAYAAAEGFASRSAVLHRAVRLLRAAELGPAYEDAFTEWEQTGAAGEWESTTADGLRPDAAG
jgi:Arc/MetJ-type ribon-helix-helix transcriptional regulator